MTNGRATTIFERPLMLAVFSVFAQACATRLVVVDPILASVRRADRRRLAT